MKSVKITVAVAVVALTAAALADANSLLYWMVDNPTYSYNNQSVAFDHAKVKAIDGDVENGASYLYVFNQQGSTGYENAYILDGDGYSTGGIYSGAFDGSVVDNFLIELYNASNDLVAWQSIKYSQAAANGSIATTMASGGANVLTVSQVVPEPTSGLLLLLGISGLALRRRKN